MSNKKSSHVLMLADGLYGTEVLLRFDGVCPFHLQAILSRVVSK